MVHPDQAGSLQGLDGVNCHDLAANNLGHRLRLATEQAKLGATCSGGILSQNAEQ